MRLFVAIDLPDSVKDTLTTLQTAIPTARWVTRDQMHLTLFFIGETNRIDEIKQALARIKAAPFELSFQDVGRFPPRQSRPPRVLWAGLAEQSALNQLQQQVTTALTQLGCEADDRPFSPHITLARLKTEKPLPAVDTFLKSHSTLNIPTIPVREFVLFSSRLTPQGAQYQQEAVYTLDRA